MLLCLLTASLVATTVVHAREFSSAPTIECSGFVHSDGDADHSQADSDRGIPHHHGNCHAAPLFMPAQHDASTLKINLTEPALMPSFGVSRHWLVDPALRPPIA